MSKYFLFIVMFFSSLLMWSQEECTYEPLKFGDVEPLWQHLIVDSTIIGYIDTTALNNNGDNFINGSNHLFETSESILHNGFVYSVTQSFFDLDISGYILEKINVETGELEWKVITDNRSEEFDYKIIKLKVMDGALYTYGVSSVQVDFTGILGLLVGYEDSYYYKRVYDTETGELLRMTDPSNENVNAAIVHSRNHYNHNFFGEEIWEEFEYADWVNGGPLLTRKLIDTLGNDLGIRDTIRSDWVDTWSSDNQSSVVNKFAKAVNDTYLYIQEFIPKEGIEGLPTYANATIYDSDLNILTKVDLLPLLGDSILQVSIRQFTAEEIVLRVNYSSLFEHDYFFFDQDFNFIKRIRKKYAGEYVEGPWYIGDIIRPNNIMYFGSGVSKEDDYSYLNFYKSNEQGSLDSIRRIYFDILGRSGSIRKFYVMENGDYIINIFHGCKENNVFKKSYSTWLRFAEEDFQEPLSSKELHQESLDITVYPNPAYDRFFISSESLISSIELYSLQGNILKLQRHVNSNELQIEKGDLPSGVYIIHIYMMDGSLTMDKLIIE